MKLVFNKLFIFSLFLLYSSYYGQYPPNTFYKTIAPPVNAVAPGYLSTYDDSSTSTRMLKITQEGGATHSYSKKQTWNIDGTKYKIRSIAIYDAETHEIYKQLDGSGGIYIYDSFWSNTNPNIIYSFREDGKIKLYHVDTEILETLYDLNGVTNIYETVKLGPGEGNIDINDKYVALVGKIRNTEDFSVIVYDLQLNQVVTTKTFTNGWGNGTWAPQFIDWISVSQSGNYVGIMWNHNETSENNPYVDQDGASHYGVEMYNTTNLNYLRRIVKYGNHGDFGFTPTGEEIFVQFWGYIPGEPGSVFSYHLDGSGVDIIHTNEIFSTNGNHLSCRNILRPGWAYLNTDNLGDGHARILAVKLDGSELIENYGHSFESSSSYETYSFPCPNPDGTKVMFKSNFGDNSSTDKICLYEAYPIPFVHSKTLAFNQGATRNEFVVAEDDNNFVSSNNWTIETWVKFDNFNSPSGENHIMRLGGQLFVDSNHKLKVKVDGNYIGGGTALIAGIWYHVAYVRSASEVKLYLNGVTEIAAVGVDDGTASKFLLGSYGSPSTDHNFAGELDEVRLWDVARTNTEINATKDVELTGTEPDLLIYYDFNIGGGDALVNRANSKYNGVLQNMEKQNWVTDSSPVPVELTLFTAVASGDAVVLNWETATEVNNYGFNIESSSDNSNWNNIGFVAGHGNSNSPNSYSFTATEGAKYYRLKQLDTDGGFEYSEVVEVKVTLSYKLAQNYPNPFNPTTTVSFSFPVEVRAKIDVYNNLGQKVMKIANRNLSAGTHSLEFDASNLSSGIYFYKIETADFSKTIKMMFLK